jgi:hypothetical protein
MPGEKMKNQKPAIIKFEKSNRGSEQGVYITWGVQTRVVKNDDGFFDCQIPEFEIYFNADNRDEIANKSKVFLRMFFDYYAENGTMNVRNLSLALIRLGFKPTHGLADAAKLTRNKIIHTQFKSPIIGTEEGVEEIEMKGELVA